MQPLSPNKRLLLERMLRGEALRQSREMKIEPRAANAPVPLAPCQMQLWLHAQLNPNAGLYNEPMTLHFHGRLDCAALKWAVQELIQRHEIWRTTFAYAGGKVVQAIHDRVEIEIPVHDLTSLPPEIRASEATRLATPDAKRPMDLGLGPLFRARLFKLGEEDYRLYLVLHHLVHDGTTVYRVLASELPALYDAFAGENPSPLPAPELQYADFAIWQKRFLDNDGAAPQIQYWKEHLAGDLRPLQIPTERPRPPVFSLRGATADFTIPPELAERVRISARTEGVTPFIFWLATFKAVLFRYTGQNDLTVGTLVDNRSRQEFADMPGFMSNTVALRSRPARERRFREYLDEVKRSVAGALANVDVPVDRILRELQIPRDPSRHPLFQAMLIVEPAILNPDPRWKLTRNDVSSEICKLDLDVQLDEQDGGYAALITYSTDLFERPSIENLFRNWLTLVEGALADLERPLGELPLLTQAESGELLRRGKGEDIPIPPLAIHDLIERQVARAPGRIAVIAGAEALTYDELNRRANRLARHLANEGARPGSVVALCVDRDANMLVAVLAILKSGAAYLPIDPVLSEERRRFILEDSEAPLILTERELAGQFQNAPARVVFCDDGASDDRNLGLAVLPESVAHVLYTSGSTGKPKGVEVPHRAVVNFLQSMRRAPGFTASDTILAVTTLSFDIAGLELYLPLSVGGKVVIASRNEARDPLLLKEKIASVKPTVMQATPATWRALIDAGWEGCPGLKILCGGESLSRGMAEQLLSRCGELWNMYGPTETTIWSTIARVSESDANISIGRPIDNTQIFILDENRNLAPTGALGEICIGGDGVSRGYLRRPELTGERFIRCEAAGGARLYRTGDIGRWRGDGTLECLGRNDHQVKIRGFRVELEEIEAVLAQHPELRAAAVKTWPDASGNLVLVGYVVADHLPDLRPFLQAKLPDYMIPSRFALLAELPLTPNFKVDRNRLPAVEISKHNEPSLPTTERERKLASIWESVLDVETVGTDDNFFDLGGHSLLIPKMLARVENTFGVRLPMASLFEAPTIAALLKKLRPENERRERNVVPVATPDRVLHWVYPGSEMRAIFDILRSQRVAPSPHSVALDDARLQDGFSIEDLAACFVQEIRSQQTDGPYRVGGWCDGGVLAFEIASQLRAQGCEVDLLVLLDSLNPVTYFENVLLSRASKLMFHVREFTTLRGEERREYLRSRLAWLTEKTRARKGRAGSCLAAKFEDALERYRPPVYPGRVLAISPSRCPRFRDAIRQWGKVVSGGLESRLVAGNHVTMFERHNGAPHVSTLISEALRRSPVVSDGRIRRVG
jgi:amino acid adenylation domain-containing protein